jgi:hypothetical protein
VSFVARGNTPPNPAASIHTHHDPAHFYPHRAYPLKVSVDHRYLVDQDNVPFLLMGDSPQALIVNLSEADADLYFADREANGFNGAWINLLCGTYTGGRPDASTFDGSFHSRLPETSRLPTRATSYASTTRTTRQRNRCLSSSRPRVRAQASCSRVTPRLSRRRPK